MIFWRAAKCPATKQFQIQRQSNTNVARKDKNLRKLNAGKSSVETIELPNMIGPITN